MTNRAVASGVIWSLIRTWGSRLVGFLIYFQLARLLSPQEMGLFSAAFAIITLMELFVDQGLIVAVLQRQTISDRQLNTVFIVNVVLGIGIALLLSLASSTIETMIGTPGLSQIVSVSAASLVLSSLGMCQEALARRALDFKLLATRTLLSTAVSGGVALVLAYKGFGVWSLVIQFLLASLLNTLMLWIRPRWKFALSFDLSDLRPLLSMGTNIMGLRLVGYAGGRGIDLIVGATMGPAALGVFAVGGKLQYIFQQLLGTALVDVAYPTFSRLQTDPTQLKKVHLASIKSVAMLSMPIWALLSACADEIVPIAFGSQWSEAAPILRVLAWLGAVQMLIQFDNAALNSKGNASLALRLGLAHAVFSVGSLFLWGTGSLLQASLCLTASQLLMLPLYMFALHRTLGTKPQEWIAAVTPAVTAGALLFVSVQQARWFLGIEGWHPVARLLPLVLLGMAVYAAALLLIARGDIRFAVRQVRQLKKS